MKKYKRKMAMGGFPVELEGGEAVQTPQGLMEVEGASHEAGGVDAMLGMEDIVYSKRLKGADGKSFAERKTSRNNKLKKAADALRENQNDAINRSTFEKVFGDYMQEEAQDLMVQDMANAVDSYKKGEKPKMKFGGFFRNVGDFLEDGGKMALNSLAAPLGIDTGLEYDTELGNILGTISDTTGQLRGQIGSAALGMKYGGSVRKKMGYGGTPWEGFDIKDFQKTAGLTEDGILGKNTQAALKSDIGRNYALSKGYIYDSSLDTFLPQGGVSESNFTTPNELGALMSFSEIPRFRDQTDVSLSSFQLLIPNSINPLSLPKKDIKSSVTGLKTPTSPPVVGTEEDGRTGFTMPNQGKIGTYLQAGAPLVTTLLNRLGDKKERNFFEDYGQDALRTNEEAMRTQEAIRDADMQNIATQQAGAFRRNRSRSSSLNSLNALDSLTTLSGNDAQQQANARFAQSQQGVLNRREGLFNDRDTRRMFGETQRFQNEVANRDNFYTQMSSSLTTLGRGLQFAELMKNKEGGNMPSIEELLGLTDLFTKTKTK